MSSTGVSPRKGESFNDNTWWVKVLIGILLGDGLERLVVFIVLLFLFYININVKENFKTPTAGLTPVYIFILSKKNPINR